MRELAIQIIVGLVGGMTAVVFANFVRNAYLSIVRRDWELW